MVKAKIIQWKCIVCGYHLEGTYQAIQHKLTYHIRVVHSALYHSTLQQRREEGCKQSGECVKALARPRDFVRDPKDAVFQCPWCDLFLTGPLCPLIGKKSRKEHLLHCYKKPKNKKCTPAEYYWLSRRTHGKFWKSKLQKACHKQARRAEEAYQRAKDRGHEIVRTDINRIYDETNRSSSKTWVCRYCLSASVGAARHFYKSCPGRILGKAPAIWHRARQLKIVQKTMDDIGLDKQNQKMVRGLPSRRCSTRQDEFITILVSQCGHFQGPLATDAFC